jgi:hypothetical protein
MDTPVEVPDGWTPHDGRGCPVDPGIKLAVLFRADSDGRPLKILTNYRAGYWQRYGKRDCWSWLPGPVQRRDIVAYRVPEQTVL